MMDSLIQMTAILEHNDYTMLSASMYSASLKYWSVVLTSQTGMYKQIFVCVNYICNWPSLQSIKQMYIQV